MQSSLSVFSFTQSLILSSMSVTIKLFHLSIQCQGYRRQDRSLPSPGTKQQQLAFVHTARTRQPEHRPAELVIHSVILGFASHYACTSTRLSAFDSWQSKNQAVCDSFSHGKRPSFPIVVPLRGQRLASAMSSVDQVRSTEDYGLAAVAQHNAIEPFPPYEENAKGLGIYQDDFDTAYHDGRSGLRNPPTPRSTTASEGVRTRSGRSTRRADSPFSTTKSRVSKSPMPRGRGKKNKLDRAKTPKLTAPLSVLTKDLTVPVKDMDSWVNRPLEVRRQEVEKRNGYVTRPMNSFMLYRSAYADRTKQWCLQNNHQVVSSVSGESWPMEPPEVRDQFNEWAKIERANHALAHPDYKFSPSKANNKKRKGEDTDEENESIDLDDPDGDYRGPRSVRQRRLPPHTEAFVASNAYDTIPYYGQQYDGHYAYVNARPLPSNVTYDYVHQPVTTYSQLAVQPPPNYQHALDMQAHRSSPQSIGGYGLPGTQVEDIFSEASRHGTPYNAYGTQAYMYTGQRPTAAAYPATTQQLLEHQQYLQAQLQPAHGIDPSLNVTFTDAAGIPLQAIPIESHFDNAFAEYGADFVYTDGTSSVDSTLAPSWSAADALK